MPGRYFELDQDIQAGYWYLSDPVDEQGQEVGCWLFTVGRRVDVKGRLTIPIDSPGRPLDYSTAGVGVTPVVHVKLASLFAEMAPNDVQILPVDVAGQPEQYCILVATRLIRCIDDEASEEVHYWKPEDGRPEEVGQYRAVRGLRIEPAKVGDAKVFRTWGWDIALIVSEDIKEALDRVGAAGAKFTEV